MGLRPNQELGADFLYEHDRAMILAPVGAGKTALTLAAINDGLRDKVFHRVLIIAPKRVATDVWPQEAKKWFPKLKLAVAVGTRQLRDLAIRSDAQIVVTNYDNIQTLPGLRSFDVVVFDELTRLKNPSGKRFRALAPLIEHINIRWGLTGSFTSNGLEDTFGQCKIVDQSLLGRSKGAFLQKYFVLINPDFGQWEPRVGSLKKVMGVISPATYIIDPGEYKDTLPPLHVVPVTCEMDRTPYLKMKRDLKVDYPDAKAIAANAGVVTGKLSQMAGGFVYETSKRPSEVPGKWLVTQTPHFFSDHKYKALADLLDENQHANTIVFYWYQEERDQLLTRFPKARLLDGNIEAWNRGDVELMLAHPASAGHGLNLQDGGNMMVFFTLPWSLELYEQAIGRLHRSGQRHDVWVYCLLTKGTIDEEIFARLDSKKALSDIAQEALK